MPNWNRCISPQASHSKNESLTPCVMCRNLEEELAHTCHRGKWVVCLIKLWCHHTQILSQCLLMGLSQRLTAATTTTKNDSLHFKDNLCLKSILLVTTVYQLTPKSDWFLFYNYVFTPKLLLCRLRKRKMSLKSKFCHPLT